MQIVLISGLCDNMGNSPLEGKGAKGNPYDFDRKKI